MTLHRPVIFASAIFVAAWNGSALAQVPPQMTPGAIGNEQQRHQQKLENRVPTPQTAPQTGAVNGTVAPEGATAVQTAGASFKLAGVVFDSSQLLSKNDLDRVARDYVGRVVSFKDLSEMIDKINTLYRGSGQVTARAVLPPQSVQNGIVHVALVEGKLGKLELKGAERTRERFVRSRLALPQQAAIDATDLKRQIVYFNRTNSVQLRALLKPGANFGETDIELNLTEPKADFLQVFVDNYGVESTGKLEGGVYWRHMDLLGLDDVFTVYATGSRGSVQGSAGYTLPVSENGDRLSFSYERNRIDIINGQFSGLDITGNGQSGTIGLTHPLIGVEHWLVSSSLSGAYGVSNTKEPAGPVTDTTTWRGTLGASASYISQDLVASIAPSFVYAHSHNDLLGQNQDVTLFSGTVSATVPLYDTWSIHAATAWQFAQQKLLPADLLFQVGGATSVRGFSSGTFAGDSGFYTNLELHKSFKQKDCSFDVFVAYDAGVVYASSPSQRSLQSLMLSGELDVSNFAFSAGVGLPLSRAMPDRDNAILYLQATAHI